MADLIAIIVLGLLLVGLVAWLVLDNLADRAFFRDLARCDADAAWRRGVHPWSRRRRTLPEENQP